MGRPFEDPQASGVLPPRPLEEAATGWTGPSYLESFLRAHFWHRATVKACPESEAN